MLTHHNDLSFDGSATTTLWSQVMSAFPSGVDPASGIGAVCISALSINYMVQQISYAAAAAIAPCVGGGLQDSPIAIMWNGTRIASPAIPTFPRTAGSHGKSD